MDCLIIGTGPAALLAADLLSAAGKKIALFERRPGPGWKLLVAGASGLNVSHDGPEHELAAQYFTRGEEIAACLEKYPRAEWLKHLEGLGEEVFAGTSRRYFIRSPKASALLSNWVKRLEDRGVQIHYGEELSDFQSTAEGVELTFSTGRREKAKTALLALGGASWENEYPAWTKIFKDQKIAIETFTPSNAGYSFVAPEGFFAFAEGKPIKGLTLTTERGRKTGELMITRYGIEGTPVYSVGCSGPAFIDLKPDVTHEKLIARLRAPAHDRVFRDAKLSEGAALLLEALAPESAWESKEKIVNAIKRLPIELLDSSPLSECISSRGGLSWDELTANLELKKAPGIFCAGEMVDWDAPTGGFLIQACVSMAFVAATAIQSKI